MTRLFLAAGVAALAVTAPLAAKPGGGGGGDKGNKAAAAQQQGGGHGRGGGGPAFNPGGGGGRGHGGGGGGGQTVFMGGGGHGHGGGGFVAPQQRVERQQARGFERRQARNVERQQSRGFERKQARNVERQQMRGSERKQARNVERRQGFERQQARAAERQHGFERQQARDLQRQQRGFERQQARNVERQQFRGNREQQVRAQAFANQQFNNDGIRGTGKFKLNGQQVKFADRQVAMQNWNDSRFAALNYGNDVRILPVTRVEQFIGAPLAQVATFAALSPLPTTIQYLYPDTPDYYYRYGDGYLYQVDRSTSLISMLLPLLGGGYLPGQYLPASYMSSYVPAYYGFNSFYPDYGDLCNRYYGGVIYEVQCATGLVEDVIPVYAGGYGVGQLLPSAYNYYNVPMQYRNVYYDTPDYGYWYAPGAIYQYDQRSSAITSVAALLSPGFTLGQPLPLGYDVYNVPYAYRATYYDTPNAWYRYNNGYIYQVDPVTQLVTAIVASLLT
jgi:hypothetical protein